MSRSHRSVFLASLLAAAVFLGLGGFAKAAPDVTVELNGTSFTFDGRTGSIVKLQRPGPGTMIDVPAERASLIDVAYPVPEFEPLRRASRYTDGVQIEKGDGRVTLTWDDLGLSRSFKFPGKVAARVELREGDDGQTVLMNCTVENKSKIPVRQVLFPDFMGIHSFGKHGHTYLRSAGFSVDPWHVLRRPSPNWQFFAVGQYHKGMGWVEYKPGGWGLNDIITSWIDLGDFHGGLSLFPNRWGWDPIRASVMLHLSEADQRLRLLYAYNEQIDPGATWKSDEFCLNVHELGWARGIVPFREWVHDHIAPRVPMPDHVRKGLGYRTAYVSEGYPGDPDGDVVFRFDQLPELARDAKAHGLDEMVLWFWGPVFQLPLTVNEDLGTKQDFVDAVAKCREIGVNVTPFISVYALANPTAARYGLELKHGWTYHTEMVPMFNPPYAAGNLTGVPNQKNLAWHKDVLESCQEWFDEGVTSLAWDVWAIATPTAEAPSMLSLTDKLRERARAEDPQSVFAGESQDKIEIECDYLDYTWNWRFYSDIRGFNNAFPAPRLNINIESSPRIAKLCFLDNVYLNVMPRKPDGVNGSDFIRNHPHLAAALKQCAKLRRQFLPYFVEGLPIGACALTTPCSQSHVSCYVQEDRMLMLVLNVGGAGTRTFTCDVGPWINGTGSGWTVNGYDGQGELVQTTPIPDGPWTATTAELAPLDIAVYEFLPR